MKNQRKLQVSLVILSLILFGLTGWTVYAQESDDQPCPEADATNHSADEDCDSEQSMQDMSMDNADVMQRMTRHCEMMAMMMRMMMSSDGTEQDMQGMIDGSDSMGESADGDGNPEQDMMGGFHIMNMLMGDPDMMDMMMDMMMNMMMGNSDMMNGTAHEDATPEPDMHGMGEGN